jgi:hypothetical protein
MHRFGPEPAVATAAALPLAVTKNLLLLFLLITAAAGAAAGARADAPPIFYTPPSHFWREGEDLLFLLHLMLWLVMLVQGFNQGGWLQKPLRVGVLILALLLHLLLLGCKRLLLWLLLHLSLDLLCFFLLLPVLKLSG